MEKSTINIPKNWAIGDSVEVLYNIHEKDVNIAIYERDIHHLKKDIAQLVDLEIEFRSKGTISSILDDVNKTINPNKLSAINKEIAQLLHSFGDITKAKSYKLFIAVVDNNMCRRFHTDINDVRMLCTLKGPGTLWLKDENVNRDGLSGYGDNDTIVKDESKIQQVRTGSVVLLKGAIYPTEGTKAVVHKSPPIEGSGKKRLLLRIDTNEFLNFDL